MLSHVSSTEAVLMLRPSRLAATTVVVLSMLLGPAAAHATEADEPTPGPTTSPTEDPPDEGEDPGEGDDDVDLGDDEDTSGYALTLENECPTGVDPGPDPGIVPADVGRTDDEVDRLNVVFVPEFLDGTEATIRDVPVRVSFSDGLLTIVVPRGEDCSGELTPQPEPEPTTSSTVIEAPPSPEPQPTETTIAAPTQEPTPEESSEPSADALAPGFRQALDNGATAEPPVESSEEPTVEPSQDDAEDDDTEVLGVVLERDPDEGGGPSGAAVAAGALGAAVLAAGGVLAWRRREVLFGG